MQYNPRTGEPIIDRNLSSAFNGPASTPLDARPSWGKGKRAPQDYAWNAANSRNTAINAFNQTAQGQEFQRQTNVLFNWQNAHEKSFGLNTIADGLGGMPIIGGVVKGAQEVLSRPGDLVHKPLKYLGAAAQMAAPFAGGAGKYLSTAARVGGAVQGGRFNSPVSALAAGASIASPYAGGAGKYLSAAGQAASMAAGRTRMAGPNYGSGNGRDGNYGAVGLNSPYGAAASQGYQQWASQQPGANQQMGGRAANPVNTATGVFDAKLFPGGPYQDGGNGDQALNTLDPEKRLGTDFIRQAQGLPQLTDMGEMAKMPGFISQYARMNNVADPYNPMSSSGSVAGGPGQQFNGSQQETDPFKLNPVYQRHLDYLKGEIAKEHQAAKSALMSKYGSRGTGENSSLDAASQALDNHYQDKHIEAETHMGELAFGNAQEAMKNLVTMFPQIYNQQNQRQMQLAQQGSTMLHPTANAQMGLARMAQQNKAASDAFYQNLAAMWMRGGFGGNPLGLPQLRNGGSVNTGGDGSGYRANDDGSPMQYGPPGNEGEMPPFDPNQGYDPYDPMQDMPAQEPDWASTWGIGDASGGYGNYGNYGVLD